MEAGGLPLHFLLFPASNEKSLLFSELWWKGKKGNYLKALPETETELVRGLLTVPKE